MARLLYGHIVSNGLRINYYRTGDEKPPVILIHGLAEYGLGWGRFPVFIEPSYDVVMMDLRGHGMSDKPETGYGIEEMADDVFWLIKSLNLNKPVIIGHSLGANVTAEFARTHSSLISGIVLEDPPWRMGQIDAEERALAAKNYLDMLNDYKNKPLIELMEICQQRNPAWSESETMQWAKGKMMVSLHTSQRLFDPPYQWKDAISQLKVPGLLLVSEQSLGGIVSPEVAEIVSKSWKKSQVVHFSGAGHFIHREQYFKFRDVTKLFLRKML